MRQLRVPLKTVIGALMGCLIFVLALVGGRSLGEAAALAGVLLGFSVVLLIAGRNETVRLLRAQGLDERQHLIHLAAMALVAQVLVVAIVAGYFVQLARGSLSGGSPFVWLGALGGATYILSMIVLRRRA
jgi:hypothetical protein